MTQIIINFYSSLEKEISKNLKYSKNEYLINVLGYLRFIKAWIYFWSPALKNRLLSSGLLDWF